MKQPLTREQIACRIAQELRDGTYVNLGIGIPTLVTKYIPPDRDVIVHSENGVLGMGPPPPQGQEDPDLCDAGKWPITLVPGASLFSSADAFLMIRGGHLDVAVLGGLQVSERGDLANWMVPGKRMGSIGGAMDLVTGAKRVIVAMTHTAKDEPKIVKECTYPLTGRGVVNLIVTDLAVIEVTPASLVLREVAPGYTAEAVQALTQPRLRVAADLREIDVREIAVGAAG